MKVSVNSTSRCGTWSDPFGGGNESAVEMANTNPSWWVCRRRRYTYNHPARSGTASGTAKGCGQVRRSGAYLVKTRTRTERYVIEFNLLEAS